MLDPSIHKAQWGEAENRELVRLVGELGKQWAVISRVMGCQRTDRMCKRQYKLINREDDRSRMSKKLNEGNQEEYKSEDDAVGIEYKHVRGRGRPRKNIIAI